MQPGYPLTSTTAGVTRHLPLGVQLPAGNNIYVLLSSAVSQKPNDEPALCLGAPSARLASDTLTALGWTYFYFVAVLGFTVRAVLRQRDNQRQPC